MFRYLAVSLFIIVSCKTAQVAEEPQSGPNLLVSEKTGNILIATMGKNDTGICMLLMKADDKTRYLLTENGAISEKQLKSTLKFMGYPAQVYTILGGVLGYLGGAELSQLNNFTKNWMSYAHDVPVFVGLTILAGGTVGYRIIKGNMEGEKAGAITGQAVSSAIGLSPVVEAIQRSGRLKLVLSDKKELGVTDKKFRNITKRIRTTEPEHTGGCDHLKG